MKLNYYLRGLGIGIAVTAILMGMTGKTASMTDEQIKIRARELGMIDSGEQVLAENSQMSGKDDTITSIVLGETPDKGDKEPEDVLEVLTENIDQDDAKADTSSSEKKADSSSAKLPEVGTKADESEDGQAPSDDKKSASVKKDSSSTTEKKDSSSTSVKKDSSSAAEKKDSSSTKEEKLAAATEEAKNRAESQAYTLTVSGGQGSSSVAKELERAGIIADAEAFDKFLCANGYDRKITVGKKVIPAGASEVEIAGILTVK